MRITTVLYTHHEGGQLKELPLTPNEEQLLITHLEEIKTPVVDAVIRVPQDWSFMNSDLYYHSFVFTYDKWDAVNGWRKEW